MTTIEAQDGAGFNSPPATYGPPASDHNHVDQDSGSPSRTELRDRALEFRTSFQLGELPGEVEGAEIDGALSKEAEERTKLGVAYKFLVLDNIPDEDRISALQEDSGHASPGTAVGLRQHLDAYRFGIFPNGPSMARQIAARIRSLVRNHDFSDGTRAVLERNMAKLEDIAIDTDALEAEQEKAEAAERGAEETLKDRAGVYVFTYPHYLLHPTHQSAETEKMPERTLMKVGHSERDILGRVNEETRATAVPEHRRVLRAYLTTESGGQSSKDLERQFHNLLDAAGHAGPKRGSTERQRGGNEWFYTSVEFLDRVAEILNLEMVEIDAPDL